MPKQAEGQMNRGKLGRVPLLLDQSNLLSMMGEHSSRGQ